jgi:sec-independent protein translocase protein TatB
MFDIAPTELLLCAVIALVVIGPKDLPKAMRFVGNWVGKAKGMARHFRSGIDTMMREAELEEMEKKWREHNEAIMRAYPQIDTTVSPAPAAAPLDPAAIATTPMMPVDPAGQGPEPVSLAKPVGDPA